MKSPALSLRHRTLLRRTAPLLIVSVLALAMVLAACTPESTTPYDTNNEPDFTEFNLAWYDTSEAEFVPIIPQIGVIDTLPAVDTFYAHAAADDVEGDSLRFTWWSIPSVTFADPTLSDTRWYYSGTLDNLTMGVTVSDEYSSTSISDTLMIKYRSLDGSNIPPVINTFYHTVDGETIEDGETIDISTVVSLEVDVDDPDGSPADIVVDWYAESGSFSADTGMTTEWTAPATPDFTRIYVDVSDSDTTITDSLTVTIVDPTNLAPSIISFATNQGSNPVYPGDTLSVVLVADDPDGPNSELTYQWFTTAGEYLSDGTNVNTWIAPQQAQEVSLTVEISDDANTVIAALNILVETPPFMLDFSTDQVTGQWSYGGLLAEMGELVNAHEVNWDEERQALAMLGHADWAHPVYYLENELFGNVTMEITVSLADPSNPAYSFIGFVPKFRDPGNYFAFGINYFLGGLAYVLRGEGGQVSYLNNPNDNVFSANEEHVLKYQRTDEVVKVWIDGTIIWQGATIEALDVDSPLGVCVNSSSGTEPGLFDDLIVRGNE